MRPHEPSARTKASGLARARMLMKARLGWLAGFPSDRGWVVVPEDERPVDRIELGREHLRRATYTANKLRGEFPRALPKLVGDVDAWHTAVTGVLAALKPWVHHGQAPPAELFETELHSRTARARARALRQEHPALRGLVDALSWMLATRADAAGKALAWVEREAAALTVVQTCMEPEAALPLCLELVHLTLALGPKAVAPLVRLLGEPAAHHAATYGVGEHVKAILNAVEQRRKPLPDEPRPRLHEAIAAATRGLLGQDPAAAKRWLALLQGCDLPPLLHAWDEWWPDLRKLAARGHALRNDEYREGREHTQRREVIHRQLLAHRDAMPGELQPRGLLQAFSSLAASPGFEPAHPIACRVLARLAGPELAPLRAGLVLEWSFLLACDDPWWNPRLLPALLRAFDEHLRARPLDATRLGPWLPELRTFAARGCGGPALDQDLIESSQQPADIARFFAVLRWLETHAPEITPAQAAHPIKRQLEAGVVDVEVCGRLVLALHRDGRLGQWISHAALHAATRVCAPDLTGFAAAVRAFERIEAETWLAPAALVNGMSAGPGGGSLPLLRELLQDDDLGPLVRCGRKLAVLASLDRSLRQVTAPAASDRAWIHGYPAALHDDLAWLCEQTEQAEPLAARLLRSIRRDTTALDDEQRAIEAMLPTATPERAKALRTRLATLARRRAAPPPSPSPVKLERLRAKLRRRGALARLEALEAAADAVLPDAVAQELGLPAAPPWALEERVLGLLVPLRVLDQPTRTLARTIMQARAGEPPWDLRAHPANAKFLAMLRQRGIDPAPWLDGMGTLDVGRGEDRLRLALEDDPLEVFHMGRHFGTCLSPGQCNFFSVFANAADVNKRVLYARDARGTVVGRRLLCLTQEGALLAFHPYCHDAAIGFATASADFARRLASAMGTVVVGRGTVPRLLAHDWYDDGPVDIAGQFDALKDGSALREALLTVPPPALPALLAKAFGRPKLDEVLAPMVLALPELAGRSDLARPLASLVRHPDRLPLTACLQLSTLLVQAGAAAEAGALLAEPMVTALLQQHREHSWMSFDVLDVLTRLAPSRTLDLLRRTRGRGVRSWEAEAQIDRLLAAGMAMEALHRPAQAIRLYRLAQHATGYDGHRRTAKERLRALDPATRGATAHAAESPP